MLFYKTKNMALIEIEGMEFYAFHGHFDVEKVAGNRFLVNLKIENRLQQGRANRPTGRHARLPESLYGGERRNGYFV